MKKIISLFLCIAMLFTFVAIGTAETVPQLQLKTVARTVVPIDPENPTLNYAVVFFDITLGHCPDFESFELLITYNPKVLEYYADYPFAQTDIVKNSIDCTVIQPGKLKVIASPAGHGVCDEFEPFCLQIIGKGDTGIEVELVSFKTVDGESENIEFDAKVYNFNTAGGLIWDTWETILLNSLNQIVIPQPGDIDFDGRITAEDARLALRAAVGLEKLKRYQYYATDYNEYNPIVSSAARDILRASCGLDKLEFSECNFYTGQEIAFGPFANAENGQYNWVCEGLDEEQFTIEEKSISDEDAPDGAPVRQYFFITSVKYTGPCDITFRLQNADGSECLEEYTLRINADVLVG